MRSARASLELDISGEHLCHSKLGNGAVIECPVPAWIALSPGCSRSTLSAWDLGRRGPARREPQGELLLRCGGRGDAGGNGSGLSGDVFGRILAISLVEREVPIAVSELLTVTLTTCLFVGGPRQLLEPLGS